MLYQVYRIHEGEEQLLAEVKTSRECSQELEYWMKERPEDHIDWRTISG